MTLLKVCALDDTGDQVRVIARGPGSAARLMTLRFDVAESPPLEGEAGELLQRWEARLRLAFDPDGSVVPQPERPATAKSGRTIGEPRAP